MLVFYWRIVWINRSSSYEDLGLHLSCIIHFILLSISFVPPTSMISIFPYPKRCSRWWLCFSKSPNSCSCSWTPSFQKFPAFNPVPNPAPDPTYIGACRHCQSSCPSACCRLSWMSRRCPGQSCLKWRRHHRSRPGYFWGKLVGDIWHITYDIWTVVWDISDMSHVRWRSAPVWSPGRGYSGWTSGCWSSLRSLGQGGVSRLRLGAPLWILAA